MSAHERTFACGHVDHEFTADDLPEHARFLASDLFRSYTSGVEIEEVWNDVSSKLEALFPVIGRTAEGARFFSWANLKLQRLTRDALEEILEDCSGNYHLNAMRNNRSYRRFYTGIRRAADTREISELVKDFLTWALDSANRGGRSNCRACGSTSSSQIVIVRRYVGGS